MSMQARALAAAASAALVLAAAGAASAAPVTATLRVEDVSGTLIGQTQATTDARVVDGHPIALPTILTLLADVAEPAAIPFECDWGSFGCGLIGIAGVRYDFADPANTFFWRLVVDDVDSPRGADSQVVANGARVAIVATDFTAAQQPPLLELALGGDALQVGQSFVASVRAFDTRTGTSTPAAGARVTYADQAATTDATGSATLVATAAGVQTVVATQDGATRSGRPTVCAYVSDPTSCNLPRPPAPAAPPATPPAAPAPAAPAPAAIDSVAPASRITGPRLFTRARRVVRIAGVVAPDRSDVRSVQFALARLVGTQCRFRQASGSFGAAGACSARTWLPARGGPFWTAALHQPLAPGRYRVFSRATDGAGNQESALVTGASAGSFTVVR